MKSLAPAMLAAGALAVLASLSALAEGTERLTVMQSGEPVGHVIATTRGDRVEVDYHVDSNGRGPKHREVLRIGPGAVPIEWRISGTSLMGGPVEEQFHWRDGHAEWRSQADQGEANAASPPLYIVNDDSPWAAGVYARALLAAPGERLDIMPGGSLRLVRLRETTLGSGEDALPVVVYRLEGVSLEPTLLMLDADRRLVAQFDEAAVTVRVGYEAEEPALLRLAGELKTQAARELQRRVAHRPTGPIRIRNVRVFDPRSGRVGEPVTVVVMRQTIVGVLPLDTDHGDASGELVIEGDGGVLIPGLHDMHAHATLASGPFHLAAGVTTIRDQGNRNEFLLELMTHIDAGEIAGPRIMAGGLIEGRSPFSARIGRIPEQADEALRTVDWYADRGYRHVKFYNSMRPDWVAQLAARAHQRGLKVSGHIPAFMSPDQAIRDGYDDIAHINQLMLGWLLEPGEDTRTPLRITAMARAAHLDLDSPRVEATIDLMREHGVALDPTAVIIERLMLSRAGTVAEADQPYLDHMPLGYQRFRRRGFFTLASAAEDLAYRQGFDKVMALLKRLHDRGVQLLPGTDDATGFTVHRELELYVQAGIPAAEVLRLATLDAASYLGLEHDSGSIERGKRADFVLLADDPTRDIRAIKRPRLVMKAGMVYFPAEIHEALSIRPFSTPPRWTGALDPGMVP